jgi:hypothetical protein
MVKEGGGEGQGCSAESGKGKTEKLGKREYGDECREGRKREG